MITGKALDECGKGIGGVDVRSIGGIGAANTMSDGWYIMSEVAMERYSVSFRHPDYSYSIETESGCDTCEYIRCDTRMSFVRDDSDGVNYCVDNCPETNNGPLKGTCVCGTRRGLACTANGQCGCGEPAYGCCDNNQSDWDADGIGQACELCAKTVGGCVPPPMRATLKQDSDMLHPNTLLGMHYEWMIVGGREEPVITSNVVEHLRLLYEKMIADEEQEEQ